MVGDEIVQGSGILLCILLLELVDADQLGLFRLVILALLLEDLSKSLSKLLLLLVLLCISRELVSSVDLQFVGSLQFCIFVAIGV